MKENRKYEFTWDLLGDLDAGRPNLGKSVGVELYRLLQFTFRDVMEQKLGAEKADGIFYEAGKLAGKHFYENLLPKANTFTDSVKNLQTALKDLGIGILRIEEIDMEKGEIVLTVSEDLDCSGLPERGENICVYDEGFISSILESVTKVPFDVKEIDCWCTGDRTCRFMARTTGQISLKE